MKYIHIPLFAAFMAFMWFSLPANAALTPAQRVALSADICANTDPAVIAAVAVRDDGAIASAYNAASAFIVWREAVSSEEYREVVDWSEVISLSSGELGAFNLLTGNMQFPYNPTAENVRTGLGSIFTQAQQPNTRAALIALSKEAASLFEELFATGTGTDADPGIRTLIGPLSTNDVSSTLNDNPCP